MAKAAGVHRSTVSRAFSRPEAVKAETREHVLRVARELGYTMNPLAQALSLKTSTFVPLIVPNVTNPFFAELADAMTQAAGDRGYQLVLCVTNGDAEQTDGYLTAMQALYAPFGIVAPSTRVDLDALARFDFGQRVIVIDRVDEGATVPSVTVDNRRGIELAFEHLRGLGHRRIGYVSGISGSHTAHERMDAYRELVDGEPVVLDGGTDIEAGERAAAHFVAMTSRPTAIIAANDMTAFGVIASLSARGLRIPEDVSVIGFDGLALGGRFNPGLTTIRQPIAEMGSIAMDLAEKKATDGSVDHVVLQPELLVRASTAGPFA
ncbi:MAG: LacI family DNA-binding transcriptional regulator [Mycobacterium sp.]|nr:LacI family DNA-binding transcriptional regulator [Mycobacterium sp.]